MDRGDVITLAVIGAALVVVTWWFDWADARAMYHQLRRAGRSRWLACGFGLAVLVSAFVLWFL